MSDKEATTNGNITPPSHIEDGNLNSDPHPNADGLPELTKAERRALYWKLDWHLVPYLTLLYLLSFLDRVNIGNARNLPSPAKGLQSSLHMTGTQYNICLSLFFVGYVLFEVPSNLLLKKLTPRIWLSSIMIVWSIIMVLMGLTQSFSGLAAARFFLGFAECGLFPGIMYYLTLWYPRHQIFVRMAVFYSAATLAGAFGGLIAYGVGYMEQYRGVSAWRWLFFIEGLLTFAVGLTAFFVIENFPEDARFLTSTERRIVASNLRKDALGAGSQGFSKRKVLSAFKDYKVIIFCFIYIGTTIPLYSLALFLPTILQNLTTNSLRVQLLTVPPYALGFVTTMITSFISDRVKIRGPFLASMCTLGIIGYALLISTHNTHVEYAAVFLCVMGIAYAVVGVIAWGSNNLAGDYKRATGMGMYICFGNAGGVVSSYIYRTQDAPFYRFGHIISVSVLCMTTTLTLLMMFLLNRENKRRAAMRASGEDKTFLASLTPEQVEDLGDNHPHFIYTL